MKNLYYRVCYCRTERATTALRPGITDELIQKSQIGLRTLMGSSFFSENSNKARPKQGEGNKSRRKIGSRVDILKKSECSSHIQVN